MTRTIRARYLYLVFCLFLFSSCSFNLLPPFSKELATQIANTAKSVDLFYLNMLEKSKPGARPYSGYVDGYIEIEAELNSLYMKNRLRPLNKESIRNCEIVLTIWRDYKEDHKKKNDLTDGIIKLNSKTMNDLFYALQVTEDSKK
jgi:hypothetical protein